MEQLTEQQLIETCMEYMKFCSYVLDKEMKRFNLDLTVYRSFVSQLPGNLDVNFDIAYNRCAFMYKYTMCNMFFFKDCIKKFLLEYTESKNLIFKWKDDPNTGLCSLSCGPGLDYLSFMLALSDHLCSPSFKNVTILSKHGAWRNTVGMVADAIEEKVLSNCTREKLFNFKNVEVIQANLLISIPVKGYEALQRSNVVLMVKSLNLTSVGSSEDEIMKTTLVALASSLRHESVIFCIDTKPSVALFLEILSKFSGKFLYKPTHLSSRVPVAFSEDYKEKHGVFPVLSVRGAFFVWQKLSSKPNLHFNISPFKPLVDVKEIPQNFSIEKVLKEGDEVSNITRSLKQLTFINSQNMCLKLDNKDVSNLYTDGNIGQSVPITSSLVNISEPLNLQGNESSSQSLLTHKLVQEKKYKDNFDLKKLSSHSTGLKKSTSIDSFFERSESFSFLGESYLENTYPLYCKTNDKVYPRSFPRHNAPEKENDETNDENTSKSNQTLKLSLKSEGTQTEILQSVSNSSSVKDLIERVKRLISSLENEALKNNCDSQKKHCLHSNLSRGADFLCCPTHNSDANIKQQFGNSYQPESENSVNCCRFTQMNDICCTTHMICSSNIHRCRSCNWCQHCEKTTCAGSSLAQPKIVIPLQNVNDDLLLQIVSAVKSGSKSQ